MIKPLKKLTRLSKIEEPGIELSVEAVLEAAEEVDEVVVEETVVESNVGAIIDEATEEVDEAVRDIAAEESRLYLRPLKESRNLLSNHLSRLYVIRPLKSRGCT